MVRIPFGLPLDSNTVNDAFQLYKTSTSEPVAIDILYDALSQTVSLTPQSPLAQSTQYTAVVLNTLKDSDENAPPSPIGL